MSFDLQKAFPDDKGFEVGNLWDMKRWYLYYSTKLQRSVAELKDIVSEGENISPESNKFKYKRK